MKYEKYTKEMLESLVKNSRSFSDLSVKLGFGPRGASYTYIMRKVKNLDIDISHFKRYYGGIHDNSKLLPEEVLINNRKGKKEKTAILREAMLKTGFNHLCAVCGMVSIWNEKPLTLQIDHINGNYLDNRPNNLRFLCPNCHSQTETYGYKGSLYTKAK